MIGKFFSRILQYWQFDWSFGNFFYHCTRCLPFSLNQYLFMAYAIYLSVAHYVIIVVNEIERKLNGKLA